MATIKILPNLLILLLACASVSQGIGIVATVDTPGSANAVYVSGDYAYVANARYGLQVVDVRDPIDPAIVGQVETADTASDVFVSGDHAYLADEGGGFRWLMSETPSIP